MSKLYTLLLVVAALSMCTARFVDFANECKHITGISNEDETNYSPAFYDNTIEVPQNFKCFCDCFLRSVLSKVGDKYTAVIDPNRDLAENPSERFVKQAKECTEAVERVKDDCEYGFKYLSCIRQKSYVFMYSR